MSDSSASLAAAVARARAARTVLQVVGQGSKRFLLHDETAELLSTHEHHDVLDYRPEELVLTSRSGTTLKALDSVLAQHRQMLAFEPPRFEGDGTLGGAVSAGLSGPGRPWWGALRDAVLGVKLINGAGEVLGFGGQVMKNVAGYDVSRLVAGAGGSLGVLLEISVRVMPRPANERTMALGYGRDEALRLVRDWQRRATPLSATAHVDDTLFYRLSGTERSVAAAAEALGGDRVPDPFATIRDQRHPFFVGDARPLWRLSLPPATAYPDLPGDWLTEWGGALRWLKTGAAPADVFAAARERGGHAMRFRSVEGPLGMPLGAALEKYHRRLKAAFDPDGVFVVPRFTGEVG